MMAPSHFRFSNIPEERSVNRNLKDKCRLAVGGGLGLGDFGASQFFSKAEWQLYGNRGGRNSHLEKS